MLVSHIVNFLKNQQFINSVFLLTKLLVLFKDKYEILNNVINCLFNFFYFQSIFYFF